MNTLAIVCIVIGAVVIYVVLAIFTGRFLYRVDRDLTKIHKNYIEKESSDDKHT